MPVKSGTVGFGAACVIPACAAASVTTSTTPARAMAPLPLAKKFPMPAPQKTRGGTITLSRSNRDKGRLPCFARPRNASVAAAFRFGGTPMSARKLVYLTSLIILPALYLLFYAAHVLSRGQPLE